MTLSELKEVCDSRLLKDISLLDAESMLYYYKENNDWLLGGDETGETDNSMEDKEIVVIFKDWNNNILVALDI